MPIMKTLAAMIRTAWDLPGARQALAGLLAALALAFAPMAWADVGPDQAAAVASQVSGGARVLSVDRVAGGKAWRVKVVTARGEVRFVMVDAATGRAQ
jgi:hypothetical protein